MNDNYNYSAAEYGVPITSERIKHHLRCLSVDCEWRADEIEQYLKQAEHDRDILAKEVREWREWFAKLPDVTYDTDESGALARAKAMGR